MPNTIGVHFPAAFVRTKEFVEVAFVVRNSYEIV